MTEANNIHEAPLPEKRRSKRRAPSASKSNVPTASEKPRRGLGKKPGKAKPAERPAILVAVLSFPGRVIATATMCVILIAAARFVVSLIR